MRNLRSRVRGITPIFSLAAGASFASLLAISSACASPLDFSGTFTDSVTNWTGPNSAKPKIDNSGGLNPHGFSVSGLTPINGFNFANSDPGGLLLTVDPQGCCGTSTKTADINVTFTLGSVVFTETALATFNYKNQTDNLCWGAPTGTFVSAFSGGGVCNPPGSGKKPTGYEEIIVDLSGTDYEIKFFDWNDWDMKPVIEFADSGPATHVPEPFTLSVFGAGLAGAVAMRRPKAKK